MRHSPCRTVTRCSMSRGSDIGIQRILASSQDSRDCNGTMPTERCASRRLMLGGPSSRFQKKVVQPVLSLPVRGLEP